MWLLYLKSFHVMAVIAWMAGMFYLPRLFIYHVEATPNSEMTRTFEVMERRLLRIIINPAMITVWLTGLVLVWQQNQYMEHWFHAKFVLVLAMAAFHGMLAKWRKQLEAGTNTHTSRFFRIANEVPTVLMAGIVIFVVVKPF
ncbi:MAG: protoporphyrinogen oxidase HemJ [Hyphomicrobiaceae bacterium]